MEKVVGLRRVASIAGVLEGVIRILKLVNILGPEGPGCGGRRTGRWGLERGVRSFGGNWKRDVGIVEAKRG